MKKFLFILSVILPLASHSRQNVENDSIPTTLDEVVVTQDTKIETAKKVILRPSKLEKRHSTNGYALIANMNVPDFIVNASEQTIATITGRDVRILINGVDAQTDELATLAASEIVQIEFQRNPGGKYAGSGAVLNFITVKYDYGGNIYLTADEGLARQYGEYLGMANYKKNAVTLTLTASGKWSHASQLNSADNTFMLNDGTLRQIITPVENHTQTNSQYVNFKVAHATQNHSFDTSIALTRSATPANFTLDDVSYSGLYDFNSKMTRQSKESSLSPVLKIHYNFYAPGGHTVMTIGTFRHAHVNFRSMHSETNLAEIKNNTVEDNILASLTGGYFKSFAKGLSLGITVDEYYNYYRDAYTGSFNNRQTLTNNHVMAMLHVDQNFPTGLSYYLSGGIANLRSAIGSHDSNQWYPKVFYGVTYAFARKHSASISGNYVHSIYNPSYKNDAVIRTSFFEATMGNPDLDQVKAFQNFTSYNGRFGKMGVSFTYDFLKYFGNTSYRYFAEDNIMYHQLVNDGNFLYHKLIFGLTANLLDDKLRLKGNALYTMMRFNSEYRPLRHNGWRADISASYVFGDWQIKGSWAPSFKGSGIEGLIIRQPAQYGITLNWQRGNWACECCVENFLDRRGCTRTLADYGVYRSQSSAMGNIKGRNISVSVTYALPYGKKTERETPENETKVSSAILRPF